MTGFKHGIDGIAGFSIRDTILTINWGGVGGPKVSTKSHDPLFINGMGGNVPT